jgi:hypothetical protein
MVKACGRGCGDVARLCLVGEALCRLAGCGATVRDSALSGVLTLLVSRLPRVSFVDAVEGCLILALLHMLGCLAHSTGMLVQQH